MRILAQVVVDQEEEAIVQDVQNALNKLCTFSYSPYREQPSLINCLEFYATAEVTREQLDTMVVQLNRYWQAGGDEWEDYGFNTPMFHPHVYYLYLRLND